MNILKPRFRRTLLKQKPGQIEDQFYDLVTVVTQDATSRAVLMVAFTDEAGYLETIRTKRAVYYSTSRHERWCKGETSGDYQNVVGILIDCDGDALVYLVEQQGEGACHTKAASCFYRNVNGEMLMPAPGATAKDDLETIEI